MRKMYSRFGAVILGAAILIGASAGIPAYSGDHDKVSEWLSKRRDRVAEHPACSLPGEPGKLERLSDFRKLQKKTVELTGSDDPVEIFFPKSSGQDEKFPTIFFSHGYGPNMSVGYADMITSLVSQGYIVVFGVYPMNGRMESRYNILWSGFEKAAAVYQDSMDLGRVGFIGHSFGGGANPYMAYQGFVKRHWGRQGGFMMELAPWYSYFMSDKEMQLFPSHIIHVAQVYADDEMNDHAMAIDLFGHISTDQNFYIRVDGQKLSNGCYAEAGHFVPGTRPNLTLQKFGFLNPLSAIAAASFGGSVLNMESVVKQSNNFLENVVRPSASRSSDFYRFKWSSEANPRNE